MLWTSGEKMKGPPAGNKRYVKSRQQARKTSRAAALNWYQVLHRVRAYIFPLNMGNLHFARKYIFFHILFPAPPLAASTALPLYPSFWLRPTKKKGGHWYKRYRTSEIISLPFRQFIETQRQLFVYSVFEFQVTAPPSFLPRRPHRRLLS